MALHDWLILFVFTISLVCITISLGSYIYRLINGRQGRMEGYFYRFAGVNGSIEMTWTEYGKALLQFNLWGLLVLFLIQIFQGYLPLNPQNFPGVPWALAFNTAVSFVTNTNWQAYAGETTLSYFTQMAGLTVQNFVSAATGLGALLVLCRGISRKNTTKVGNFWTDLVRSVLYLFLPLATIMAIVLVEEGVIQNFSSYVETTTLEGAKQTLPMGPAASQVAIKQLGTNGGGFFNTNSSHPFENPTALSNFLQMLAILVIPASLTYTYGRMIGSTKHGWLFFAVMFVLWGAGLVVSIMSEQLHNPVLEAFPNMEGKETRFGIGNSLLWSTATTGTSNGSVNTMHDSLTPLSGGIALFNMMLGELLFGGVGVGLCSMIMFVLLTVFLCGLMVGRTPEYLGKKIEKREIQWVIVAILTPAALILLGAGVSVVLPTALSSLANTGPHGLSELLYAFASAAGNNGSAFAGLNANTTYFNLSLAMVMMVARVAILLPSLAIGGLLANKNISPPSSGTFSTSTFLFFTLLCCVILIVGALTFFPVLVLGPIVEHFLMLNGRSF